MEKNNDKKMEWGELRVSLKLAPDAMEKIQQGDEQMIGWVADEFRMAAKDELDTMAGFCEFLNSHGNTET